MTALQRVPHWPDVLDSFVEANRARRFEYGTWDCCIFSIEAVKALTGATLWRVTWTNEAEALQAIADAGGLVQALSSALGRPSQNWAEARRGDLVLVDQQPVAVPMLCLGATLCGPSPERMEFKPLHDARLVWRVG